MFCTQQSRAGIVAQEAGNFAPLWELGYMYCSDAQRFHTTPLGWHDPLCMGITRAQIAIPGRHGLRADVR